MNAKKTLARLNKELHDTAAALHEESSIKNFRVFLGEITPVININIILCGNTTICNKPRLTRFTSVYLIYRNES